MTARLTILLFLFSISLLFSQSFYKAELVYLNGNKDSGYAKVPDGSQKKVTFKKSEDSKPESIKSDDLFTIKFYTEDDISYTLERNNVNMIGTKKNGEVVSRTNKKKGWFLIKHDHELMNYYTGGQKYKINRKGEFLIVSKGQAGFTAIGFYYKKPSDKQITYITATTSAIELYHEKMFRNTASTYLNDNKELSERIKNKEFKSKDVYKVYLEYIGK